MRLEPDEGRLSGPVLRGPGRSNPARLPDPPNIEEPRTGRKKIAPGKPKVQPGV